MKLHKYITYLFILVFFNLTGSLIFAKASFYDNALLHFYKKDYVKTENYLKRLDNSKNDDLSRYSSILRFLMAIENKKPELAIKEYNKLQFINDLPDEYKQVLKELVIECRDIHRRQ